MKPGRLRSPAGRIGLYLMVLLGALTLNACAAPRTSSAPDEPTSLGQFNRSDSNRLVTEATAAADRGDYGAAVGLYRAAGLAWPDNDAAWQGLRDAARAGGLDDEAAAAAFMVGRVRLYNAGSLAVQREVNRALRRYIASGGVGTADSAGGLEGVSIGVTPEVPEAAADRPAAPELEYATALADFYDLRFASRGDYEPLQPVLNIDAIDVPAVIATGVFGAYYGLGTVSD